MNAHSPEAPQVHPAANLALLLADHQQPTYDVNAVPAGQKYVVLCNLVSAKPIFGPEYREDGRLKRDIVKILPKRVRGDVCSVEDLGGPAEVCRLLFQPGRFLRAATPFEATQAKVTIEEEGRNNKVVEELLADERRAKMLAVAQLDQAQAENARLRSLVVKPPEVGPQASRELIVQKDQAIESLTRQVEAMREQMAAQARENEALRAVSKPAEPPALAAQQPQQKGNGGGQGRR